ncbi:MAG: hypothetical protein HRU80_09125 [Ignavibacteriales bacterium]|nr:MAG: hypothetical protein HRU80_09125 [Ignavibacteriales bacterium]
MNKKVILVYMSVVLFSAAFLAGCSSELNDNIATPPAVSVHPEGIVTPSSANFHGKLIKAKNWDMNECKSCHGTSFTGAGSASSCYTCHTQPAGPLACNTCHGDFSNPAVIYPPQDLMDRDSSETVGAHALHMQGLGNGPALVCGDCHTVPATAGAAGHLDNTPGAEIVYSAKSSISTNVSGHQYYASSLPTNVPNPRFVTVPGTNKKGCADSYCHGSFKNGNPDNIAVWSAGADGAKCGSCHGDVATGNPLPKTTANGGNHPNVQNCSFCHGDVVSVSGTTYTIIDKQKHINGKLNVYGTEVDY